MATAFDIRILYTVFQDARDLILKKKENIIEAHEALNDAFIKTYNYLINQKGDYVPKPELAEVWNSASAAVMRIDLSLGEMLYHKSRFWLDPDLYINLNRDTDIIELRRVIDEMERMRLRLGMGKK